MSIRTDHSCSDLLSVVLQKKGIYFTVFYNQYCQFTLHGFFKIIFSQTCPFRTDLPFKNDLTAFINRQAGYATRVFLLCGCCYRERGYNLGLSPMGHLGNRLCSPMTAKYLEQDLIRSNQGNSQNHSILAFPVPLCQPAALVQGVCQRCQVSEGQPEQRDGATSPPQPQICSVLQ